MEELWGLKSSNGMLNSLVFTCSIVMCVVSFLYCIFRDPGRPLFDYVPEMSEEDLSEQGLKKNVCGQADVWGDGVVPEESAHLDGALNISLDGVYHSPVGSDDVLRPWYGSPAVVEKWIQHLLD